jgi:hypothetical protein
MQQDRRLHRFFKDSLFLFKKDKRGKIIIAVLEHHTIQAGKRKFKFMSINKQINI